MNGAEFRTQEGQHQVPVGKEGEAAGQAGVSLRHMQGGESALARGRAPQSQGGRAPLGGRGRQQTPLCPFVSDSGVGSSPGALRNQAGASSATGRLGTAEDAADNRVQSQSRLPLDKPGQARVVCF